MSANQPALRIFSYLPNPRIFKATVAARLCGVELEIRGASPRELAEWLWDFDARPLQTSDRDVAGTEREARTGFSGKLYKTRAFLDAIPFGTVPAAFSPDGSLGIFESNSIMRAVARLGEGKAALYGRDAYSAARVDSFLDVSLVFARDSQLYLLALAAGDLSEDLHERTASAVSSYFGGIDRALEPDRRFLVGDDVSLADICFVAEAALLANEGGSRAQLVARGCSPLWGEGLAERFPRALAHFARLCEHDGFAPDLGPYLRQVAARAAAQPT